MSGCKHDDGGAVAQLADTARLLAGKVSELNGLMAGNSMNAVLLSGQWVVPSAGAISFEGFAIPMGAVFCWANEAPAGVTVHAAALQGTAPLEGVGVCRVPAGGAVVTAMTGNVLTVYGTAGESFHLAVWSKAQPPSATWVDTA